MTTFIFIHGPNGVGKSSVCHALQRKLQHSARLESEWCRMINPFILTEESIALTIANMTQMLQNYLSCSWLDYVIMPYGFHGARQHIWDTVQAKLQSIPHNFVPITLTCSEGENIARMVHDGRSRERIQRAIAVRCLYESLPYPRIDTTSLTIDQTVDRVIKIVQDAAK